MFNILMTLILALGFMQHVDPPIITVQSITWYYGTYQEPVYNGSVIYVGPGINNNITMIINYQGQLPINITYRLSIGNYITNGTETLNPGINTINITTPALSPGFYEASLTIDSLMIGFSTTYTFSVNATKPILIITTNTTTLYSGVPQIIDIGVTNGTPIPITLASITMSTENAYISTTQETLTSPSTYTLTITPGPYSARYASIRFNVVYTDAGGYVWSENETITFNVNETPVNIIVKMSGMASYGTYLPITIIATTPVGYLENQPIGIYVDNNYIATVTTNNNGEAEYRLPINFNVGNHTLTITFMNNTYFEEIVENYAFVVIPGTVQIIPYVSPTEVTYGQSVYIKVALSPAVSSGTLTISYIINGQKIAIGGYTPINGTVELTWTPPQAGVYVLNIYYTNPNYLPSSYNLTIIVNKASCSLTITINGNSTVFHNINIVSFMNPPIINAPITLSIKGINESLSAIVSINSSGYATYAFTPTLPGEYNISAYWGGNINYNACSSSLTLTVDKASSALSVNINNNITVVGDYLVIVTNVLSDIPNNYLFGNVTIVLKNLTTNSTKLFNLSTMNGEVTIRIPINSPGSYEVLAMYNGNAYVKPSMSKGTYLNVLPGLFGIPWYVLLSYLAPLILGFFIGFVLNKYLHQSS